MTDRISKRVNAADYGFLPDNPGKANCEALTRAMKNAGYVFVDKAGIYDISGAVPVPSDTHFEFGEGVILRRVPLEDRNLEGNLFINEGAYENKCVFEQIDGTFNSYSVSIKIIPVLSTSRDTGIKPKVFIGICVNTFSVIG